MSILKIRKSSLALLALNALVYGTLVTTAPLYATEDSEGEAMYAQECVCIRVDPKTNTCVEWEASGCPRAKVQTCGSGCP